MSELRLTHVNERGEAHMVDVTEKQETWREAVAVATLLLKTRTLDLIEQGQVAKGSVFAAARIAGIMAAKRTPDLIPLCHPLPLSHVDVELSAERPDDRECGEARIRIRASARCRGQTGVEMEALTAASIAALTLYDMCKAVDREMIVRDIYLAHKEGGKSGSFDHPRCQGDAPVL